ncbi:MAG: RsmB/NOP family class I SAM-dependent RNA methyltransferase [Candidatus Omnitrophota bacterium]|nr:RsmB/NOP family class I SAM-dependent RNA methyltransferase [Candidatus Omnitrophota bacterium]
MNSIQKDLPPEFLERLRRIVPESRWGDVLRSFSESRATTFRVNPLKTTRDEIKEQLKKRDFAVREVAWYEDAFIFMNGQVRDLQSMEAYARGEIYIQGLASMLPALFLKPEAGMEVLDLAAAPGSKTTQIAAMMSGQGRLVANDNNRKRYYKLRALVKGQGADFATLECRDGGAYGRQPENCFDRVLLDAPCSSEARFRAGDPATYQYWRPRKIHEMAHKQRRLLEGAVRALKPGGLCVYSTCSYGPEENEAILDFVVHKYNHSIELEDPRQWPDSPLLSLSNAVEGMPQWEDKTFDASVTRAVRILPNEDMEGFFIACIRKLK